MSRELKWTDLEFVKELGKGSFGEVALYRWKAGAVRRDGEGNQRPLHGEVAIKTLLPSMLTNQEVQDDFVREVELLTKLNHSCIVRCVGTGLRPEPTAGLSMFVAMEAVTGGDLGHMVMDAMSEPTLYNNADIVHWLYDISRGLHYLHTRSPMVIHRDLKLENVLLDNNWEARLTDFGLVKAIAVPKAYERVARRSVVTTEPEAYVMTGGTGSLKYMSPETAFGDPATEKVDIFSFSICAWELWARRPLLLMRHKTVKHHGAQVKVEYTPKLWARDSAKGKRAELPDRWPNFIRQMIADCWQQEAAKRPSAADIMKMLEQRLERDKLTDPRKRGEMKHEASEDGCCTLQ